MIRFQRSAGQAALMSERDPAFWALQGIENAERLRTDK